MASGVLVAAYLVSDPVDVETHGSSGILNLDLSFACSLALNLDRREVRQHVLGFSWESGDPTISASPILGPLAQRAIQNSSDRPFTAGIPVVGATMPRTARYLINTSLLDFYFQNFHHGAFAIACTPPL